MRYSTFEILFHVLSFFIISSFGFFFALCRFFNILKLHLVPLWRGFFPHKHTHRHTHNICGNILRSVFLFFGYLLFLPLLPSSRCILMGVRSSAVRTSSSSHRISGASSSFSSVRWAKELGICWS